MTNQSVSPLMETEELLSLMDDPDIVILDSSWHLPTTGRSGRDEYLQEHLPGAEEVADDLHAVHQRAFDHVQGPRVLLARLLGVLLDEVDDSENLARAPGPSWHPGPEH